MKNTTLTVAIVAFLCFGSEAATHAQEFPRGGAPSNPAAAGNTTVASQLNQQLSSTMALVTWSCVEAAGPSVRREKHPRLERWHVAAEDPTALGRSVTALNATAT